MSREDEVGKTLGKWLGKAKQIGEPPRPADTTGTLMRAERVSSYGDDEQLSQLNFKIPNGMKKRIKQLAVRDNITLLVMLERMVELYEKEHGKLSAK
jgi:hypothetical protein